MSGSWETHNSTSKELISQSDGQIRILCYPKEQPHQGGMIPLQKKGRRKVRGRGGKEGQRV